MLLFDLTEGEDLVNVLNGTACFILCDYVKLFAKLDASIINIY